jgi:hypothetical protein
MILISVISNVETSADGTLSAANRAGFSFCSDVEARCQKLVMHACALRL